MDKKKTIEREYFQKRRYYEEQEEKLSRQKDKGIAILEEVQDRSHYYLKDFVSDNEMLINGLRQLDYMKEEVLEAARSDFRKLSREKEELDREYHRKLRNSFENQE